MLAGAVSASALLLSLTVVHAGDPIQFSNGKAKPAPNETRPGDKDVFKSLNKSKAAPASPLNSITPFITQGRPTDSKEERRLKNIREEKKNWMLLEPGELQQREEDEERQFGGRSVAIDDNDTERGNYLFYGVGQQKSEKPQNAPRPDDSEDQAKKDTRSMSIFGPRQAEQPGAHTANELNLKGLIDPTQVNANRINNNDTLLFQFLKDNSTPAADRDQQARRDNYRDFINGPQPNSPAPGLSDPINFRTDLTQERMNPIMPTRAGFDLPPTKTPDSFSAKPSFGGGLAPARAPGLPEIGAAVPRQPMTGPSLPSPFLTPNDADKTPRASVMGNGSLFNREGPRRGGL
jgi:hypothetical protein